MKQRPNHPVRPPRAAASWIAWGVATALGVGVAPAFAQQAAKLAERLAGLRAEVETLSSDLSDEQQSLQDQLRSLSRQKSELQLELQREQTRLQKLRAMMAKKKQQITEEKQQGDALRPLFTRNLTAVRSYVSRTLPFRTSERLTALDKIEEQLQSGLLTPERALMRLWTFVEDEFRLTRENGMYRQTIRLDGEEQLADVVRLGMVALYFSTSDDRAGYAVRAGDGWDYREVSGEDERRVMDLFDSFKKQIRVGYFELPNALVGGQP